MTEILARVFDMYGSSAITRKIETEVEMALTDSTVMIGAMYIRADQRVIDIVNDDRRFVPFAALDGPISVINKEVIARITPIERAAADDGKIVAIM